MGAPTFIINMENKILKTGRQTGTMSSVNMITKKSKLHINQILKLPIGGFGRQGDLIFYHKEFMIFVKPEGRIRFDLHKFMEIRITKISPTFALAVMVSDNINKEKSE